MSNKNWFRNLGIVVMALALAGIAIAQEPTTVGTWTKLKNQPTFNTDQAILLTDGTVIMHEFESPNWWRLTPTNTGSYIDGTWSQIASMQSNYGPLYFASAILPDGRLIVEGGEYNCCGGDEVTLGSIYDPVANKWTAVNPPSGWTYIGDSPGIVLPNGTFMMGQGASPSKRQVEFNASNLTWTAVGTGKADGFSEEGFALLPNGNVLTVDTEDGTNSETFNPTTNAWTTAGSTIVELPNSGGLGIVPEMGPLMQSPKGFVVAFGATTSNAIYNDSTATWAVAPSYPNGDDIADGPAAALPDGNILVFTSPGVFNGSGTFYEFDGTSFTQAPATASAGVEQSWEGRLITLPTGQVLYCAADGGTIDAEIYTPKGSPQNAWRPKVTSVPTTLTHGNSYTVTGTQLNGLTAGSAYGDDAQNATSYPLVVIRNKATGHFFFARTSNFSQMGIATGSLPVTASFAVPSNIETGASMLYVVANGIPSAGKAVTVN